MNTLGSVLLFFCFCLCQTDAFESISGRFPIYREICAKAVTDPHYFQNFRSMPHYRGVVELDGGDRFAKYIVETSPYLLKKIEDFRKLDSIGNPILENYPVLGDFSATALRYIVIADLIQKQFQLPDFPKIVEIGAGFGGQCYIFSQLFPFSNYYIYDLPEVENLIEKTMKKLSVRNVKTLSFSENLPEETVDLCISNYAFSECDRETQLEYFKRVILKSKRGYIIYNQISEECGINSLTPDEFFQLLKDHGFYPQMKNEFFPTAPDNKLIIWDRTKIHGSTN